MLALHGSGVGQGIAIGKAVVLNRQQTEPLEYVIPREYLEDEVSRFREAVRAARIRLNEIHKTIPAGAPSEVDAFINAHMLMLQDPLLVEAPVTTIRKRQYNAEWALKIHAETLILAFDEIEDSYLRSKKVDVQQVVDRVMQELTQTGFDAPKLNDMDIKNQIVVSNDLAPADAVALKNQNMAAFVTNLGGPISHTAILARSLHIPAVVGLHGATRYLRNGDCLVIDGQRGVILVEPDKRVLAEYQRRQSDLESRLHRFDSLRHTETVTRDGERVNLMANIELPDDIEAVRSVGANGVGLYRTEFLYMNRPAPPDEEEQLEAYTRVLKTIKQPVVIRTLDLGADKQVGGGRGSENSAVNPALGRRAVRLCLHEPDLFRPQLRAIYRASAHGSVQMMVPMISSLTELNQVLTLIEDVKQELNQQGHDFDVDMPIGVMIEVPAAAVAADLFAQRVDFLSIGTNDLIQYTLAIDRIDDTVNYLYDPLHPSVLRLIENTIRAGRDAGIPVSMCGEMAGNPAYTHLLMGLGLRTFSMDPATLLDVKQKVIEASLSDLESRAEKIMQTRDPAELKQLITEINQSG